MQRCLILSLTGDPFLGFLQYEPLHDKTCHRVFDQVRLKQGCSASEASEASYRLEIFDIETRGIIMSKQRITTADLRLFCSYMAKTGFLVTWLIWEKTHIAVNQAYVRKTIHLCCYMSNKWIGSQYFFAFLFTINTEHIISQIRKQLKYIQGVQQSNISQIKCALYLEFVADCCFVLTGGQHP